MGSGALHTEGDLAAIETFASVVEDFDPAFNLVTP
ncbi:alkyl sulfatase C-terminal domain-containing protein [Cellulomonas sp. McL0617]